MFPYQPQRLISGIKSKQIIVLLCADLYNVVMKLVGYIVWLTSILKQRFAKGLSRKEHS